MDEDAIRAGAERQDFAWIEDDLNGVACCGWQHRNGVPKMLWPVREDALSWMRARLERSDIFE